MARVRSGMKAASFTLGAMVLSVVVGIGSLVGAVVAEGERPRLQLRRIDSRHRGHLFDAKLLGPRRKRGEAENDERQDRDQRTLPQ